jgi:hypothetical protein
LLCQDLMEAVRWDRDPERVAVADFAIREQAQRPTVPILPMEQVRTGDFPMAGIRMEELSTGVILTARASVQAVAAFRGAEEEDAHLAAAEAAGTGNHRRILAPSSSTANGSEQRGLENALSGCRIAPVLSCNLHRWLR